MSTRKYTHLYREERLSPFGHRIVPVPLPYWIYVTVTTAKEYKYLTVHSKLHTNNKVRMNPVYGLSTPDHEIIKDLSSAITSAFL